MSKSPRSRSTSRQRTPKFGKVPANSGIGVAPYLSSQPLGTGVLVGAGGDPSVPSLAYTAALPDWGMTRTILSGARAVRSCGVLYLPRFADETDANYDTRVAFAPFVNHFRDSLETIVSKPFSKEIALQGEVTPAIRKLCENIDGQGSSLHKFARDMFKEGVGFGVIGVLVDLPNVRPYANLKAEREGGDRPYWVTYRAEDIIALYTDFKEGRRFVTHVRLREDTVRRVGFSERRFRRVRVLNDDMAGNRIWQLWEEDGNGWTLLDEGGFTHLDEIPFRLFKPGEREWWTNATVSPLIDLAYMQIEHYQQSSNLKHILELAGFPMLAGNGLSPPMNADGTIQRLKIGPGVVCYAPPQGIGGQLPEWKFIEPAGTSIDKLQVQINAIEQQMSTIGKAPLVRNRGGITATAEAVNAAKGHAAAEAWAIDLKDSIEELLVFSATWLNEKIEPEVYVHTDFGVELRENRENAELMDAVASGLLSRDTLWDEWRRRAFLGPQFVPDEEQKRIAKDDVAKVARMKQFGMTGDKTGLSSPSAGGLAKKTAKTGGFDHNSQIINDKNESQTLQDITGAA